MTEQDQDPNIDDFLAPGTIDIPEIEDKSFKKDRGKTANLLAQLIVYTYCLSLIGSFIFSFRVTFDSTLDVSTLKDRLDYAFEVFKTVSSFISGPLGFVLGFYFRND